jgi:hypothetical protein
MIAVMFYLHMFISLYDELGNHLLRPFSKIVARIQYFGRKCNPETNPNVTEVFTAVTMKTSGV